MHPQRRHSSHLDDGCIVKQQCWPRREHDRHSSRAGADSVKKGMTWGVKERSTSKAEEAVRLVVVVDLGLMVAVG